MPKKKQPTPTPTTRTPKDVFLRLAMVDALIYQGLVPAVTKIPALAPEDAEDADDESESWRDRFDPLRDEAEKALLTLLERQNHLLAEIREINFLGCHIYESDEDSEDMNVESLEGIEACVKLEKLALITQNSDLDLTPLTALERLEEVDLGWSSIRNLEPLCRIPRLKRVVVGPIDEEIARKLARRKVDVSSSV